MGMTNEEREKHIRVASVLIGAINDLIRPILMYQIEKDVTKKALENYIKMLEQQPCEDCINRQAVLDKKELVELEDGQSFYCINPEDVETLPSVTPHQTKWIPVSERLPKAFEFVNCTCHSLIDDREDWVIETVYIPQPSDSPYSDWGNIPMLNSGDCKVVAWMHRDIPEPYKAESEE